jgi:prepilin-type N-terminal cleavage/methylation domain-containing protein
MASRKISRSNTKSGGFTLIEMLVALSLVTMIASITLLADTTNFRGPAFRAEAANLATALQTARADALNNVRQSVHGVAINPGGYAGYVVFEGTDYATANPDRMTRIPSSYRVALGATTPNEVTFEQLSGDASFEGVIELVDPHRNATTTITLNHEGLIDW